MRKFLSMLLAVTMLLSTAPQVFAAGDGENGTETSEIILPIALEDEWEYGSDGSGGTSGHIITDSGNDQTTTVVTDNGGATTTPPNSTQTPSSGGSGDSGSGGSSTTAPVTPSSGNSSGGGSTATPATPSGSSGVAYGGGGFDYDSLEAVDGKFSTTLRADAYGDEEEVIKITIDKNADLTAEQGGEVIFCFNDSVSNSIGEYSQSILYGDMQLVVFKKGDKEYYNCPNGGDTWEAGIFRRYNDQEELCRYFKMSVPKELETGTYSVVFYSLINDRYTGTSNHYISYMTVNFELTVTTGDGEATFCKTINPNIGTVNGGAGHAETGIPMKNTDENGNRIWRSNGVAFSDDGEIYPITADIGDGVANLYELTMPVGQYTCCLYSEGDETLFTPFTLSIAGFAFNGGAYFKAGVRDNSVNIQTNESLIRSLLVDEEGNYSEDGYTLTLVFKNAQGNTIYTVAKKAYDTYSNTVNLNLTGFKAGKYSVSATASTAEESINLGETVIEVTDKVVINNVSILNYGNHYYYDSGKITTATEYFYVRIALSGNISDADKLKVAMVDADGNEVTKQEEAFISRMYKYNDGYEGTTLLYKLKLKNKLDASYDGRYSISIKGDDIVSNSKSAYYVNVTSEPTFVRAEYSGNTVKIFTENMEPGEYTVEIDNNNYTVTINEQGVGSFLAENLFRGSDYCSVTLVYKARNYYASMNKKSYYNPASGGSSSGGSSDNWYPGLSITTDGFYPSQDKYEYDEEYAEYFVGNPNVSFKINTTTEAEGGVSLIKVGTSTTAAYIDDETVETLAISALSKAVVSGKGYTYTGTFTTKLEKETRYRISLGGNLQYGSQRFSYTDKKIIDFYNSGITAIGGTADISCDILNATPENLTYKAVMQDGTEHTVTITGDMYRDGTYANFDLNFASVPAGYFTLKAYYGTEEVKSFGGSGYNYGNTSEILVKYNYRGTKDGVITYYGIYGKNLKNAKNPKLKIYKEKEFKEGLGEYDSNVKLDLVKELTPLSADITDTYIRYAAQEFSDLEKGYYTLIYTIDDEVVAAEESYYIDGKEAPYSAEIKLNDGLGYTNKSEVSLKLNYTGYTKVRYAMSESALENAEYVDASDEIMVNLGDEEGDKIVFVQFANDDLTEASEILQSEAIKFDKTAPVISNISGNETQQWSSATITFTTDELLRSAFLKVTAGEKTNTYNFSLENSENGVYTYSCNLYAGSDFYGIYSASAEISGYDMAGNALVGPTTPIITTIVIIQPATVSGYVKDENGNAVSSARVYISGTSYSSYYYTGSNGYYNFSNVPSGDYNITVERSRFVKKEETLAKADFATGDISKDITLEGVASKNAAVTVTVKDAEGNPVENIYVYGHSYNSYSSNWGYTDAEGKAIINLTYYDDNEQAYIYVSSNNFYEYKYVTLAESMAVDVTMPAPLTITGTVKHGETPVSGVEVQVQDKNNYYNYEYATTDSEGKFEFKLYNRTDKNNIKVTINADSGYSGSADVTFEENSNTADVTIAAKGNIKVKGSITNKEGAPATGFRNIEFYDENGWYITYITCDENGNFESGDSFGAGKYKISAYQSIRPQTYKTITKEFEITEEELEAGTPKELNLEAERVDVQAMFNSNKNSVTASMDMVSVGENVTVNIRFHNDGTKNLSNVKAYANIPEGLAIAENGTNGTFADGEISKTVELLKADEKGNLSFTLDTSNYTEKSIVIAGYVEANGKTYSVGSVKIDIVSVTLSAPKVVKSGEAFAVSGESVPNSIVEILDYNTKAVLARKSLVSKWYSANIDGITEDTKIIAKVTTKDGSVSYSEPATVKVEDNPVSVDDIEICWRWGSWVHGGPYHKNEKFGYATFSVWEAYPIDVKVTFDNMPEGATVKYLFAGLTVDATKDSEGYYNGTFGDHEWSGYGTKKITAIVTTTDNKVYEFIIGEALILVDPSGIITDAETGEPIEGVKVTLEAQNGNDWELVDPEILHADNPMYTDADGNYGWMVPEGTYRIIAEKAGYTTRVVDKYDSVDWGNDSTITVLPARTDVNFTMTKNTAVELDETKTKSIAGGRMKFVFTRPVQNVDATTFKISDSESNEISGTLTLSENNTVVLFKPENEMAEGSYTLTIAGVKDSANNEINQVFAVTKGTGIGALTVSTATLNDGNIVLTFDAEPDYTEDIEVKNSTVQVSGTLVKNEKVLTFVPDSALGNGTYTVTIPATVRTSDDKYIASDTEKTVTIGGGGSSGGSGGGGGGAAAKNDDKKDDDKKDDDSNDNDNKDDNPDVIDSDVLVVGTKTFTDVKKTDWFYDAVKFAAEKGITSGVSDSEYAPQAKVTRGQFITMLCRAYGIEEMEGDNFADAGNTWYTGYLAAAKQLGISAGVGDNMFDPEKEITREEMVTLIYNYLKSVEEIEAVDSETEFADNSSMSDWAKQGIAFANRMGYVNGKGDNLFDPKGDATRAELAQIFYNIFK